MNIDEINYALQNILHRRLRSGLSILSIMIGIAAVFALVSFGLGIQNYVNTLAAQTGTDKMFIQSKGVGAPGTDSTFYLSQDDLDFVSKINGVKEATGIYMHPTELNFKDKKYYYFLLGLDMNHQKFIEETATIKIDAGRDLKKGDFDKVVLGHNYMVPKRIFEKGIKVGDKIKLNGQAFEVVGFYAEVGNPSDDAQIYVTKEAFESLYPETKDKYGYLMLQAQTGVPAKALADRITERLRKHKGEKEGKEDFFVQTFEDAIKTFTTIINVLNGILVLIALVSVLVASVNIMNTMYTAVIERTKEIGVMKAVGARNSDIMFIFILEAGAIGAIGGILGVLFGFIVASIGGGIAAASGYSLLKPFFPWYLTVSCILFAFLIGAGAGIMPAYKASRLRPVDSLRYE